MVAVWVCGILGVQLTRCGPDTDDTNLQESIENVNMQYLMLNDVHTYVHLRPLKKDLCTLPKALVPFQFLEQLA